MPPVVLDYLIRLRLDCTSALCTCSRGTPSTVRLRAPNYALHMDGAITTTALHDVSIYLAVSICKLYLLAQGNQSMLMRDFTLQNPLLAAARVNDELVELDHHQGFMHTGTTNHRAYCVVSHHTVLGFWPWPLMWLCLIFKGPSRAGSAGQRTGPMVPSQSHQRTAHGLCLSLWITISGAGSISIPRGSMKSDRRQAGARVWEVFPFAGWAYHIKAISKPRADYA